uniref:TLC domain-containing protein n=1 Tax=Setaria digitata TaxID=48799 RepID=A0A915PKK8_9BILA
MYLILEHIIFNYVIRNIIRLLESRQEHRSVTFARLVGNYWVWQVSLWIGTGKSLVLVVHRCYYRFCAFVSRNLLFGGTCLERVPSKDSLTLDGVTPPNRRWRISNEAVSLGHSVVSGFWALYAIIVYPKLIEDMVNYTNTMAHYVLIMSTGYLLHDLADLLINEQSLRIIELLFHHIVVLIAFGTNYATNKFLGVVVCGLLMELNSIFLHSRSMLNLYRVDKSSTPFRIIALLNIVTFIIFRVAVSIYLLYWQITTAWRMVWYLTLVTFVVIVSLAITNIVLLYRVLAADGLLGKKRQRATTGRASEVVARTGEVSENQLPDEDEIEVIA